MEPGFYWYKAVAGDPPDLEEGQWEVVRVARYHDGKEEVYLWGSEIGIEMSEMLGKFVGPLKSPEE